MAHIRDSVLDKPTKVWANSLGGTVQITHSSDRKLELRVIPGGYVWALWAVVAFQLLLLYTLFSVQYWLLGGLFLAAALVFSYVAADLGRKIHIVFDRDNDTFRIRISGPFGSRRSTHPVSGISHVEIQYSQSNTGKYRHLGKPMRPVLITTDNDEIPLNDYFDSGTDVIDIVAAINRWLDQR